MDSLQPADSHESSPVKLWHIAHTFLRIGLASFSLAALGEAKNWMTKKRRWFTDEEYMQGLGLAQLMPGAPTVNLSAYLGFRLRGLPGAAAATIFFLIPCFLLMLLLSHLYLTYGELPIISGLFRGLGALVVGLVCNTIINLWRSGVKTVFNWLMAFAGFSMVFWLKMGIVRMMIIAGSASLLMVLLRHRFPSLSRWTGSWGELWGNIKSASHAGGLTGTTPSAMGAAVGKSDQQPASPAKSWRPWNTARPLVVTADDPDYVSACSRVPLPLRWQQFTVLAVLLALFLAIDLFLINLRPELARMGGRFLEIGALVFGSGYAMLPFIQDAVVNRFHWLSDQQFAVSLALSLITPGPVTIIGTFIGYKVAGVAGALVGMINMYFPAWAMTAIVAAPYAKAGQAPRVRQVVSGIVASFIGTLVLVLIKLSSDMLVDVPTAAMATGAFLVQRFIKVDTVWIVLGGAVVSLVLFR